MSREAEERRKAEDQVKRVPSCDGGSPQAVREWVRNVALTIHYSGYTVYIASQSATGPLRRELEHFLSSQENRQAVTWTQLRDHLQQAFLSPHEDDRLRHEVEKTKQGAYENSASYSRRFREAVDLAYPPTAEERNVDLTRNLLRLYLRGIRDRHIVERLVKEGRPTSFSAAMTLVQSYEADNYRLQIALDEEVPDRVEEPMEIGAFSRPSQDLNRTSANASSSQPGDRWMKGFNDMQRQVSGLATQFTKLMATLEKNSRQETKTSQPSSRRREDQGRRQDHGGARPKTSARPLMSGNEGEDYNIFDNEGEPLCNYCHKTGHIARNCLKRKRRDSASRRNPRQSRDQGNC